jgi:predicted outer membrane repeat protein
MYTANPTTPTPALATGPRNSTLRPPWWTIPEADRLHMHASTRPSNQLRQKVRAATLRSLHHTSLYIRLVLKAKVQGARIDSTGDSLHTRLRENPREGSTLLKFINGQLYNGKLAKLYGHAPTDECPLCYLPDSCTHSAGECKFHKNLSISRHNAACQLVHAAIRNSAKGGGALYSADDLRLVAVDAGTQLQTPLETLTSLASPPQDDPHPKGGHHPPTTDWFEPLPPDADTRHRRHTNVSQDLRYAHATKEGDTEYTRASTRIPE